MGETIFFGKTQNIFYGGYIHLAQQFNITVMCQKGKRPQYYWIEIEGKILKDPEGGSRV